VIRKLLWYRAGGETSERQWRDVIGILKASAAILDFELMRRSARERQIDDLLERAIAESAS